MMNQHKPLINLTKSIANLSEFNPQLLRELKGRLKGINIIISASLSIIVQLFIVINRLGQLPEHSYGKAQYSRYCFGQGDYSDFLCHTNSFNHWDINWQLFCLDTFIDLSIVTIISLLVVGVYLLISDLIREKQRGTLNFIQFTPQSAKSILVGKILGVPILLYLAIAVALPVHFGLAFKAGISFSLIVGFEVTIIACCWFFYSLALLFSLLRTNFVVFKPWLGSGIVSFFLLLTIDHFFYSYNAVNDNIFSWIFILNPIIILSHFIEQITNSSQFIVHNNLSSVYSNYLSVAKLQQVSFYGQHLWGSFSSTIGFILVNYYIWQYWIWKGIKRCFDNPNNTSFSKSQSYWLTGYFVFYALGFTLQTTDADKLFDNFILLQCFLLVFFLGLMSLLSPKYQTLQDWTRYRHQAKKSQRMLWKDLILGEKSPSIFAIVVNVIITTIYIIPALLIFDFNGNPQKIIWGLILGISIVLLYGFVAQLILLTKNRKRSTWALVTVLALVIIPPIFLETAGIPETSSAFLITFLPTLAIKNASFSTIITVLLGQWLAISLAGFGITQKLSKLGKTETALIN